MAEVLQIVLCTGPTIEASKITLFERILLERNSTNSLKIGEEISASCPLDICFASDTSGVLVVPANYGVDEDVDEDVEKNIASTLSKLAKESFKFCLFGRRELSMPLTDPTCLVETDNWLLECLQMRFSSFEFDLGTPFASVF
jgi:hypothetical protein